jgi:hypothetical protein
VNCRVNRQRSKIYFSLSGVSSSRSNEEGRKEQTGTRPSLIKLRCPVRRLGGPRRGLELAEVELERHAVACQEMPGLAEQLDWNLDR